MRIGCSIVIPTYNEAKNIRPLIEEVCSSIDTQYVDFDIIIVDDNSPDGTGTEVLKLVGDFPVRLVSRSGKQGLGSAVRAGFAESDASYLFVMDADLSHDPAILNDMIQSLDEHDIVIGSRFLSDSSVEQWAPWRKFLSYLGVSLATRITRVQDPLSGYFGMKRAVIDGVPLNTVGYKILFEILVKGTYTSVKEIPFTFRIRQASVSKLDMTEYRRFLWQCLTLWWSQKKSN